MAVGVLAMTLSHGFMECMIVAFLSQLLLEVAIAVVVLHEVVKSCPYIDKELLLVLQQYWTTSTLAEKKA